MISRLASPATAALLFFKFAPKSNRNGGHDYYVLQEFAVGENQRALKAVSFPPSTINSAGTWRIAIFVMAITSHLNGSS